MRECRIADDSSGFYHRPVTDARLSEVDAPDRTARLGWSASLALAVLAFLVPRLLYIARGELSGDEAVFGLMALEIGRGESYPLYCWGAHYASALVSYMAAPLIALFGPTPFALRLAVIPWGIAQVLLTAFVFRRRFGMMEGILAAFAIAVALPDVMTFSVMAHGGYPETYFLGLAIWVLALAMQERPTCARAAGIGILAGASFAILWLGIPFIIAAAVLLAAEGRRLWKRAVVASLASGAIAGSFPFWAYNLWIAPGSTFLRLGARSLEADRGSSLASAALGRIANLPQWALEVHHGLSSLFEPAGGATGFLVMTALAAWGAARLIRARRPEGMLVLAFVVSLVAFNLVGNLTRGRHWTPLWFVLVWGWMGLPRMMRRALFLTVLVITIVAVPSWLRDVPNDPHARVVAAHVAAERSDALVADYDIGYPTAYRLGGRIPVAAISPPNPSDRRPDWTERIRTTSRRPALLLPRESSWHDLVASLHESGAAHVTVHLLESRVLLVMDAPGHRVLDYTERIAHGSGR